MTIARVRLGRRNLSFSIDLEPTPQDRDATTSQLEARYERQRAAKALDQQRSAWDSQLLSLGHRPV